MLLFTFTGVQVSGALRRGSPIVAAVYQMLQEAISVITR